MSLILLRTPRNLMLVVGLAACTFGACTIGNTTRTIDQFIAAVQTHDIAAALQLTHQYREQQNRIKAKNPRTLWEGLTAALLENEISNVTGGQSFWQQYNQALTGGGAGAVVKSALILFPDGATSQITETKTESIRDSISFGPFERTIAFVRVSYSESAGPIVSGRRVRQSIVSVSAHHGTNGVVAIEPLTGSEEFWPISQPTPQQLLDLSTQFVAHKTEPWIDFAPVEWNLRISDFWTGQPFDDVVPRMTELKSLLAKHGVDLVTYTRDGYIQHRPIDAPPEWQAHQLPEGSRQDSSHPYSLVRATKVQMIRSEMVSESEANVELAILHEGLSPIGRLIKNLRELPPKGSAHAPGDFGPLLFRNFDRTIESAGSNIVLRMKWSIEQGWYVSNVAAETAHSTRIY